MRQTCTNISKLSKKRSTVGIYINADCLFKNMSTKHNKCLVDQIREHINVVSLGEPVESVYCFLSAMTILFFTKQG